ncbi:MAG TPA: benzoate-CoA ligase family protein [Methylomirabilota bacterium]|jgi:benzoate-CoA ligase|nr:benzoate-CoA ligase family protein [Methylomirabilota bacterium]
MTDAAWLAEPLAYERLPEQFNIVPWLVDRHLAEGRGAQPAILTPDRTVTYADLAAGVARAARLLDRLGIQREQRVALLLPDSPEFAYVFLGAMKAGMVPVPLSTLATAGEVEYALADSRAVALVAHADLYARVEPGCRAAPMLRHRLVVGDAPAGTLPFDPAHAAEAPSFDPAPTHRDDMAYWLYSSGTTGRPKAIVHLHHDMLFCVEPYLRHVLGLTAADRTFAVPRLFFSYGLTSCLYLPLWRGASTVLVADRPDPARVFELCAKLRPTIFFSVPTSYAALLRELDVASPDLSSVRLTVSAGEPLSAPLYHRWVSRTGIECLDGLGATEVGYIYISNRPGAVRSGSSGQLLPGYRARIVDEGGGDVAPGTVGELWMAGESVAAGYWNKHAKTKATFVGEWFRTGDRYRMDADGYYFYEGRTDDLLRVGANWVSPLEIETCLLQHPAVAECAVVGGRDGDGLEKPRAYVVLQRGAAPGGLEDALRAHVRAHLAPYKAPRWVTVVDELPKTATGKIQRYRLRAG